MDSLAQDLLQELECPICMEYMLPPIVQCTNGHNICHSCKPTLEHCPTCRGKLVDIRTRAMENLSYRITHPCKYSKSGCTAHCLVEFKEQHEKKCLFIPHKCPHYIINKCAWIGSLLHLEEHIKDAKHYIHPTVEQNLIIWNIRLKNEYLTRGFIFIFDEIFFCHTKQMNNLLHVVIMFVGMKEQAKNYNYIIRIKTTDEEQSMSACFKCRSYFEFVERPLIFLDARSALFPKTFWENKTLVDNEKLLPITLEVMRSTSFDKKD